MCLKPFEPRKMNLESQPSHLVFVYDSDVQKNIIGAIVYTTTGFQGEIRISSFLYLNSKGKYDLLRYLAIHIDQFFTIKFPVAPYEHPENWLTDLNIQISNRDWVPSAMARVVNVEGLQSIMVGTGSCVLEITDKFCLWNNGIFEFKSEAGTLAITKKEIKSEKDCQLSIEGLTALVYGFYSLEDFIIKKWIENASAECFKKLELLFSHKLPQMHDLF